MKIRMIISQYDNEWKWERINMKMNKNKNESTWKWKWERSNMNKNENGSKWKCKWRLDHNRVNIWAKGLSPVEGIDAVQILEELLLLWFALIFNISAKSTKAYSSK